MNLRRNVLLIDTSCHVFCCYMGLAAWYRKELGVNIDHEMVMENKEFIDKYVTMFRRMINKYQTRCNVPDENVILVKDCLRSSIWRREIYPEYKKNRDDRKCAGSKFNSDIFRFTYDKLISHTSVEIQRAEADDVIAVLTKAIHDHNPITHTFIVSNDNDFIQLADDYTHILDMKGDMKIVKDQDPREYLMTKVIMGDQSDNIPPIMRRCGKKKAMDLVQNPSKLIDLLKDNAISHQFELNRRLIDFRYIPDDVNKKVCHMFKIMASSKPHSHSQSSRW